MTPCAFCGDDSIDTYVFDVGNNAEIRVSADICGPCIEEFESDESAFVDKYADKLDRMASER